MFLFLEGREFSCQSVEFVFAIEVINERIISRQRFYIIFHVAALVKEICYILKLGEETDNLMLILKYSLQSC